MATLAGWLLSMSLVQLPHVLAESGPPAVPSNPNCYISCDDDNCWADIYCVWDQKPDPQIPTNYSLHWETAYQENGHVSTGASQSGIINRQHFSSHSELHVWVQAENQNGSARSKEVTFNTGDITKPPPPKIASSYQDPPEINWNSPCNQPHLCLGSCIVRYRTEEDLVWVEAEIGSRVSYELNGPVQPSVVYEFQVRCACCTGLMSDWSVSHRIKSSESSPVGELDVWKDCGIFPTSLECVITWKVLPISQARGHILGYEVTLSYNNGTVVPLNVSTAGFRGKLVCGEMQCYLNFTLQDVSSASVSAYNSRGAMVPSHLPFTAPVQNEKEEVIHIKMNTENLSVSWDQPSDSLSYKEYVVQYKQAAAALGEGFDWIRVNKSHKEEIIKGPFQQYTLFQVSLFTVSHTGESRRYSSVVGYSLQGPPSKVHSFKVVSIATTHVTLFWDPGPLSMQNGIILHYKIGVDRENEYIVNAPPQHRNMTFELLHLHPGREYEVSIHAVTAAGPGPNVTARFKTKHKEHLAFSVPLVLVAGVILTCGVGCLLRLKNKCPLVHQCFHEKVPDPYNSRIFKQMRDQIHEPLTSIWAPNHELLPVISVLEIIEIQPSALKSPLKKTPHPEGSGLPAASDGCLQIQCQRDQWANGATEECDWSEHRCGKQEYSKMVDSDEERDRENSYSLSDEEQFTSGYEKHFMPTVEEVIA